MRVEVAVLGGRPNEPSVFRGRKAIIIEPCSRISLSLSVICKPTSEDIQQHNRTIWMSWSWFWPNVSGPEASRCARIIGSGSGRTQPARFQCPTFGLSCILPQTAWIIIIVQNQPGSDWVLADCVRFGPDGSGPETNRCAIVTRPASGESLGADPDRMRIGSSRFTGSDPKQMIIIIIITIDNFCISLFSGVPKLTALYNILQHFLNFTKIIHIIMTTNNV